MNFFVTGVGGQLGHDVMNELLKRGHEGVGSDIQETYSGVADGSAVTKAPYVALDITDKEAVEKVITEVNPDAVIHCAAWTAVDMAEDDDKVAKVRAINAGGTQNIADVNPKELIKFNGFFTKLPNGEYLLLNEEGYQVEGQKGTWTVTDEKTIDEQRFVLMVNDQKPDLLPSIVVQSDGKFITSTASGFDNATVRKVRELLHHEKFLENGTAERARESGTEQNYNMIDGCVNNVPKKPRVIGGRVSVLDRLHIKQAERARKDNAQVQQQERTRKN